MMANLLFSHREEKWVPFIAFSCSRTSADGSAGNRSAMGADRRYRQRGAERLRGQRDVTIAKDNTVMRLLLFTLA